MTSSKNLIQTLFLFLFLLLLTIIYFENFLWLISKWRLDPDYSHGPMIPVIALYLVYQKKKALFRTPIQGSNLGLIFIFISIVLQFVAIRGEISFLSSYSFILILFGIVLFLYGKNIAKSLSFPLFFLIFMVPFWDVPIKEFSNMLKVVASIISGNIILLFGVPVFREGVMLHLPNGSLEVADPCSGIRSLLSIIALGVLFSYLTKGDIFKRMILVVLGIPLVLLGNIIRIVIIGLILAIKNIMISEGFFHDTLGVLIFCMTFSIFFLIHRVMSAE